MGAKRIIQFGYMVRVPKDIPLVDCRGITNPWQIGNPAAQSKAVRSHPKFPGLVSQAMFLLGSDGVETIGIGCAFGRHRSGEVAEEVKQQLFKIGIDVEVERAGRK